MPECCQAPLARRHTESVVLIEILPDILGRDPGEIKATPLAPCQESLYGV